MFNVKELAKRLGLTEWQTRKLVYACRPLLEGQQGWLGYGQNGELLIGTGALALLERAKELKLAGTPGKALAARLAEELGKPLPEADGKGRQTPASPAATPNPNSTSNPTARDPRDELIEELRARIQDLKQREEDLQAERDRLLKIIENQAEQLRALMPGPGTGSGPEPKASPAQGTGAGIRIGRWRALRYALLGR